VLCERRKHGTLLIAREMEKAVPRYDRIELNGQDEATHIRFDPYRVREAFPAHDQHFRRCIDASQFEPALDKEARDRFARATAKIEHPRFGPQPVDDIRQVAVLHQGPTAIPVEWRGMGLVQFPDIGHEHPDMTGL